MPIHINEPLGEPEQGAQGEVPPIPPPTSPPMIDYSTWGTPKQLDQIRQYLTYNLHRSPTAQEFYVTMKAFRARTDAKLIKAMRGMDTKHARDKFIAKFLVVGFFGLCGVRFGWYGFTAFWRDAGSQAAWDGTMAAIGVLMLIGAWRISAQEF